MPKSETTDIEKAIREMLARCFADLPNTTFTGREVAYIIPRITYEARDA